MIMKPRGLQIEGYRDFLALVCVEGLQGRKVESLQGERSQYIANRGSFWWTAFYVMDSQLPGCLTQE